MEVVGALGWKEAIEQAADALDKAVDGASWLLAHQRFEFGEGHLDRSGGISKMGNRYFRRLLYRGAMAQIMVRRRSRRSGTNWRHQRVVNVDCRTACGFQAYVWITDVSRSGCRLFWRLGFSEPAKLHRLSLGKSSHWWNS